MPLLKPIAPLQYGLFGGPKKTIKSLKEFVLSIITLPIKGLKIYIFIISILKGKMPFLNDI